jgi:hypothetical protein
VLDIGIYTTTDTRKKVYASTEWDHALGFDNTVKNKSLFFGLYFQPLNALKVSLTGSYSYYWRRQDQFVSNVSYNNAIRTIVSEVKQKTLRFVARINYNITPDLTIQYYGQPYIARPRYSNFAYVSSPLAKKYEDRFHIFKGNEIKFNSSSDEYLIDENADGITDYSFNKPDFNFVQFRSNLVVRWEYRAGSEFYLVWSQSNTPDANADLDTPIFRSLFDNAFAEQSRNIFLVKWTYRFLK